MAEAKWFPEQPPIRTTSPMRGSYVKSMRTYSRSQRVTDYTRRQGHDHWRTKAYAGPERAAVTNILGLHIFS